MSVTIDGTLGVTTPAESVTGTGVWSVGSTQIYKDASGNVGIGTSSPTARLHVSGSSTGTIDSLVVNTQSSTTAAVTATSSTYSFAGVGANTAWFSSSGALALGNYSAYPIQFVTNGAERARIDSSGNLLVGTTSSTLGNNNGMYYAPSSGGGGQFGVNHASGIASGSYYMAFAYNGSEIGSIKQNGTTGVLYNLTSDYRLKNDPQPLTGAKEFVMALQPKKWQWWDGSGEGVGFIAHEFMEVAKYSGNGEKDAVDADGNPVYQSIQPSSSEVMANLVSLLQEQQAIITQLQADVAALKGNA